MTEVPATLGAQADELLASVSRLNDSMQISNRAIVASNDAIVASNARIAELAHYGQRNRKLIRVVAISVCLDIALSIGLSLALYFAHSASTDASKAAQHNKDSAIATCKASNGVRANDITLWTYIIAQQPQVTEADKLAAKKIGDFVKVTFAPRVC